MTYVQLGKGLSEKEITERLLMSFADRLEWPVHHVPEVRILKPAGEWPLRGVMVV